MRSFQAPVINTWTDALFNKSDILFWLQKITALPIGWHLGFLSAEFTSQWLARFLYYFLRLMADWPLSRLTTVWLKLKHYWRRKNHFKAMEIFRKWGLRGRKDSRPMQVLTGCSAGSNAFAVVVCKDIESLFHLWLYLYRLINMDHPANRNHCGSN